MSDILNDMLGPASTVARVACRVLERDSLRSEFKDELTGLAQAGQELLSRIEHLKHGDNPTVESLRAFRHDCINELNVVAGYAELILDALAEQPDGPSRRADIGSLREVESAAGQLARAMTLLAGLISDFGTAGGNAAKDVIERTGMLPGTENIYSPPVTTEVYSQPAARLLVVDDDASNRDLLQRRLTNLGYQTETVGGGSEALATLQAERFDLVLLDLVMPEMTGYEVLAIMKSDALLRQVPVIVVTALEDSDDIARCFDLGAAEYLPKTFSPVLLNARIAACLTTQRLLARERRYAERLRLEQEGRSALLRAVMPLKIAGQVEAGAQDLARRHPEVTVMFAQLVNFGRFASVVSAPTAVERLDAIFASFDKVALDRRLDKVKTVGDTYIVAGGLTLPRQSHVGDVAAAALDLMAAIPAFTNAGEEPFKLRVGLDTGPVVAGLIGRPRLTYDLWGDTVDVASRLQRCSVPGGILVSASVAQHLGERFALEAGKRIELFGRSPIDAFYLMGKHS